MSKPKATQESVDKMLRNLALRLRPQDAHSPNGVIDVGTEEYEQFTKNHTPPEPDHKKKKPPKNIR